MPRKSANARIIEATIGPDSDYEIPAPPPEFGKAQARLWTETIESMPPGHFSPGNLPLLELYCIEYLALKTLSARLKIKKVESDGDEIAYARLIKLIDKLKKSMQSTATKMRLTQQSQYTGFKVRRAVKDHQSKVRASKASDPTRKVDALRNPWDQAELV